MKKIFLIALLFLTATMYGQQLDKNSAKVMDLPVFTLNADTSYTFRVPVSVYWSFEFVWVNQDSLTASIDAQISNDGVNFSPYPGLTTLSLTTATSFGFLRDASSGTIEKYIRLKVNHGTNTAGTLSVYGNFINRK